MARDLNINRRTSFWCVQIALDNPPKKKEAIERLQFYDVIEMPARISAYKAKNWENWEMEAGELLDYSAHFLALGPIEGSILHQKEESLNRHLATTQIPLLR